MNRILLILLAAVLACSTALADDAATKPARKKKSAGKTPAAATAPATAPASQPATAKAEADEDDDDAMPPALLAAARQSLVVVEIWYKKDVSEPTDPAETNWRLERIYEEYVDAKRPRETQGLVIGDNLVLIEDDTTADRFIDKIVVRPLSGGEFPARRQRLLDRAPGMLLAVETPKGKTLTPPEFCEANGARKLRAAVLQKHEDQWRLGSWPMTPSISANGGDTNWYFRSAGLALLARTSGEPVGCSLGRGFDLKQQDVAWCAADLRGCPGSEWQQLSQRERKITEKLSAASQEIIIRLHPNQETDSDELGPPSRRYSSGSGAAGREITAYGMAISPTDILVFGTLDAPTASAIDKFFVKLSPTDQRPLEFVGAYKNFGAFLLRAPEGVVGSHIEMSKDDPGRIRPFWTAELRKRFGRKHAELTLNRLAERQRGYGGAYHWVLAEQTRTRCLLVDFDGRLLGMLVNERREDELQRRLERQNRYYRSRGDEPRVFLISELASALKDPKGHLDPKVQVKSRIDARRRAWLGIEYVGMTGDLAERLKVEKPTKDGQLGLVINAVYPGSPADKLGLRPRDVLLKLQTPVMPYPVPNSRRPLRRRRRLRPRGGDVEEPHELPHRGPPRHGRGQGRVHHVLPPGRQWQARDRHDREIHHRDGAAGPVVGPALAQPQAGPDRQGPHLRGALRRGLQVRRRRRGGQQGRARFAGADRPGDAQRVHPGRRRQGAFRRQGDAAAHRRCPPRRQQDRSPDHLAFGQDAIRRPERGRLRRLGRQLRRF